MEKENLLTSLIKSYFNNYLIKYKNYWTNMKLKNYYYLHYL